MLPRTPASMRWQGNPIAPSLFWQPEAIAAYVESEEWQLAEIQAGQSEFDAGPFVSHDQVSRWLKSWGKGGELKAPR